MPNKLADGASWLGGKLQSQAATSISYVRGGTSLSITATRGASGRQIDQLTGIISWHDQDWLIPATVLTNGPPRTGDKIVTATETYEVLPPTGEDCWRWSDNNQTIYRIHSKRYEA